MVAHETEGEEAPFGDASAEAEQSDELRAVVVVAADVATVDAAHREVVGAEVGKVVTVEPCHRRRSYRASVSRASALSADACDGQTPGTCPHDIAGVDVSIDRELRGVLRSGERFNRGQSPRFWPGDCPYGFEALYARSSA